MLTTKEIEVLMPLLDAGVRATGLRVFQGDAGSVMQSALQKLQQMAEEAATKEAEETASRENDE